MAEFTRNQLDFVERMKKSPEHARQGFELLLKRPDFDAFFEALQAAGLFDATQNPEPTEADDSGGIRVPFWAALPYLVGCAQRAGERGDLALAAKVLEVVLVVSTFRLPNGSIVDNYHTFRAFAEIIGHVPPESVSDAHADLVQVWLTSRFDRDGVAHALDAGALKRFLASQAPADWKKANSILRACLIFRWTSHAFGGTELEEPVSAIDPYWLHEIVSHHAGNFGRVVGAESSAIFRESIRAMFGQGSRVSWNYLIRPAVEDHTQNHGSRSAENCVVEGLRDVLLSWCDVDASGAIAFTTDLLRDDLQILRRIGIFVLNERWTATRALYLEFATAELFQLAHVHELYHLLSTHFEHFSAAEKKATLEAIHNLPAGSGDESDRFRRQLQLRWLSAIPANASEEASKFRSDLLLKEDVEVPEHPDFLSYMESSWGPGPTPYRVEDLVQFAERGEIVDRLNTFTPDHNSMRAATMDGLVASLEQAVIAAPAVFTRILSDFSFARFPFQYSVIAGFKRLWDSLNDGRESNEWDARWSALLGFMQQLLTTANPEGSALRTSDESDMLVTVVADFLDAGTRDDERAFSPAILPEAWTLVQIVLDQARPAALPSDDPMMQALNCPKGRAIQALLSYVLRESRLADKLNGSHAEVWNQRRNAFDREVQLCVDGNYEFATISAAHIVNLEYLDPAWVTANISKIFATDAESTFDCAMAGFAYSSTTRRIYELLRDQGVFDRALRIELKGNETRKSLIERVMLAYLWGAETLELPRLSYIVASGRIEDLEAASWFLWTMRNSGLEPEQRRKVVDFWEACVTWVKSQREPPGKLLASLGSLSFALDDASGRNYELLLATAPHIGMHTSVYEFFGQLLRLVDQNPAEIARVLEKVVSKYDPSYDYEDRLKALIGALAAKGQRATALALCDRLRNVPGVLALFAQLTSSSH